MGWLTKATTEWSRWIKLNPKMAGDIMKLVALIGAGSLAGGTLLFGLSALVGMAGSVAFAFGVMGASTVISLGLIVPAIAEVAGALYLLDRAFKGERTGLGFIDDMRFGFDMLGQSIGDIVFNKIPALAEAGIAAVKAILLALPGGQLLKIALDKVLPAGSIMGGGLAKAIAYGPQMKSDYMVAPDVAAQEAAAARARITKKQAIKTGLSLLPKTTAPGATPGAKSQADVTLRVYSDKDVKTRIQKVDKNGDPFELVLLQKTTP